MKKTLITLVAAAFIAFGFTPGALAAGMDNAMDKSMSSDATILSAEFTLIGKDVKNSEGEELGKVKDLVRDDDGEISLVILSFGGFIGVGEKDVAVPYTAFSFNESENHAVVDVTKEQLASAPEIGADENLTDRAFAEEVYRHFGERPYWNEEGLKEDMKTGEGTDTREYFGTDEGLNEGLDADRGDTHQYYGTDEGLKPDFDADRDMDLDTNQYFGTDKGVDTNQDLPRGGAGLNSGMDSE